MMEEDMKEILYTKEEVAARIRAMGEQLTKDYAGELPMVVGVLRGSFIFMADLVRSIQTPLELDFVAASSYGSWAVSTGKVEMRLDKPERRVTEIEADYVGFTVPDEFVVGCGLDFNQKYRQLPYIGILKPSIYE